MNESPATRIVAAMGWIGLVLFLGWQEFYVETYDRLHWITPWWFRVPVTAMFGLVVLVFALECMMQEMTVRRWATSALVFAVFGVLFIIVGIFDPDTLQLSRWLLIPLGVFYLVAAGAAGIGAKDSL
jgi:hypothetical protein